MKACRMAVRGRELVLGQRTLVMGIVNVTPDSFSDGGLYEKTEAAVARARALADAGADILDIGGESTRPFSDPVSEAEELARVAPVIEAVASEVPCLISIDTTRAVVAEKALALGAHIINDISALRADPRMGRVAEKFGAAVVLMHMAGTPKTMQEAPRYGDVVREVRDFLAAAIQRAGESGVSRDRVFIDPGIGFGKTVAHNLLLIQGLDCLNELGVPVLLGPSRKTFIRRLLTPENGQEPSPRSEIVEQGTQAVLAAAVLGGARAVRVHDVARARATLALVDAIRAAENP